MSLMSPEPVAGWDKFKLCEHRKNYYIVRWQEGGKTRRRALQSRDLVSARQEAVGVVASIISPAELIEDSTDPALEEIWPLYEAHRAEETTERRQDLLRSRWFNYYRDRLGHVRCSRMEDELRLFRNELVEHGRPWKEGRKMSKGVLHPNTIQEIVDAPRAAVNYAIRKRKAAAPLIDKIKVAGFQKPIDRTPKGRYLSFEEIGAMVDNSKHRHVLDHLLLELGLAARIGATTDLTVDQVFLKIGMIDLQKPDAPRSPKQRPLVPISGPMWWVLRERMARDLADRRVILFRSEGVSDRTRSQTMRRLRVNAGLENPGRVTWYSIRHTLGDWMYERVSGKVHSMMLGHGQLFDSKERRMLLDAGSPTSEIYRRETLKPLYEVAKLLDEEWWPQIQRHCDLDLRLGNLDTTPTQSEVMRDRNQSSKVC